MLRGEDVELGMRIVKAGFNLIFEAKAKTTHYANEIWSYEKWLKSFQRFYKDYAQIMIELYPDEYDRWAHWFVERPDWGREEFKRSLMKALLRGIAKPRFGSMLSKVLERFDSNSLVYYRGFYGYILTCAAIDAVNRRSLPRV
jgi:GT2 family glycosyltransferase